ncbi:iron-containing alcohol dehydrogenase family protein [Natrialbaceae archaeon AArc-T1-2]|uniref:iron-containing alcohol dehydrogenase family protein n=1 Tax=Natrialbaceae archaeon AArc-T1-2 TaxID=3053904 RepID=UPI00255AF20C|nr:iron-containing alcohol dehydrogenase [Natrialbaceae archaeon AArc-T1-2]WIV66401.1 iron-containing alcohol dehydrogenase [Natrialbaceae archaeon AArc-T1-2]
MQEFVPPPRTYAGPGSRSALSRVVDDGNVHVVTDEGVVDAGVLEAVLDHLPAEPTVHATVSENPDRETVAALAARVGDADLVVGVGGGSPMDATKAACTLPAFHADVASDLAITAETPLAHPDRAVPFVLVPTTAGTGTETGYWAVISDHDRSEKVSVGHPAMLAEAAVLDPELTTSLPPTLTAGTGFDVITHAVESLVADGATALTIPYSRQAYALAASSLRTATTDGENLETRERLLEASYLAGVAMNNAGLGAVHAISHAISGRYDLPHGHTNARLLPAVVRHNGERSPQARERYATLVETTEPAHEAVAARLTRLRRDVGLDEDPPGTPDAWALEAVADSAIENVNMDTNPASYTESDVVDSCRRAFDTGRHN